MEKEWKTIVGIELLWGTKKHWPALETRHSHTIEYVVSKIVARFCSEVAHKYPDVQPELSV